MMANCRVRALSKYVTDVDNRNYSVVNLYTYHVPSDRPSERNQGLRGCGLPPFSSDFVSRSHHNTDYRILGFMLGSPTHGNHKVCIRFVLVRVGAWVCVPGLAA